MSWSGAYQDVRYATVTGMSWSGAYQDVRYATVTGMSWSGAYQDVGMPGDRDVIERQLMTRIHQGCEYVVFPGACDI